MAITSAFRSLAELAAKKAPYDDALAMAQRRAALPVSEGGLGLRPDNTPMERAAAMGHTTPAYFGAGSDVPALDVNRGTFARKGTGSWMSESGQLASTYAGRPGGNVTPVLVNTSKFGEVDAGGRNWNVIEPDAVVRHSNGTDSTLSEYGANGVVSTNDLARLARSRGDTGLQVFDVKDIGPYPGPMQNIPGFATRVPETADNMAVFDPSKVRSRFAAFDPFRRGESDLLAGLAPYAVPTAAVGLGGAAMAPGESEAGIAGVLAKTADVPVAFTAAGRSALFPTKGNSAYSEMMDLKRAASDRARTHGPVPGRYTPSLSGAKDVARTIGGIIEQEAYNPLNYLAASPVGLALAAMFTPRELGDPQALNYADPYYSYNGATRR